MLGVSEGIAREGLELIRAQVGMTGAKRAAVVAYGEVVFRAWKDGGWVKGEVGEAFLQGMVEGAVHAGSKEVAKAARKILSPFVEQRAVAGVEKLVFQLAEPVLFRSLQVYMPCLVFLVVVGSVCVTTNNSSGIEMKLADNRNTECNCLLLYVIYPSIEFRQKINRMWRFDIMLSHTSLI